MIRFIETVTENGVTIMFNVDSVKTVLKDKDGKAIISIDSSSFKSDLDYEELKKELIPSKESAYNDPNVKFSC